MPQQQLTEEDLKKMTPEQIRELQKQNCIFCHIISGRAQAKKVYEDEKCIAILDIYPSNPGHVLLLPKEHHALMPLIPEEDVKHLGIIAKKISHALLKALKVQGTNIFIANGQIAGQKAPHFMMHIIPRKEKDGLHVFDIPKNKVSEADQKQIQQALKKKIDQLFGLKTAEPEDMDKKPERLEGEKDKAERLEETKKSGPEEEAGGQEKAEAEQTEEETEKETERGEGQVVDAEFEEEQSEDEEKTGEKETGEDEESTEEEPEDEEPAEEDDRDEDKKLDLDEITKLFG